MRVQKRNQRGFEDVKFDKITARISSLCSQLSNVNATQVAIQTITKLYDCIKTEELDRISAEVAESYSLIHPEYSTLAARLIVSNLHKTTPKTFSACMTEVYNKTQLLSDHHYKFIMQNASLLDTMIVDTNDYLFNYTGLKTLESSYFAKVPRELYHPNGHPVLAYRINGEEIVVPDAEYPTNSAGTPLFTYHGAKFALYHKTIPMVMDRPQYLFMRVAIAIGITSNTDEYIHVNSALEKIKRNYKMFSQLLFTHATPTLFNACAPMQQLGSCFLLGTADSIEEIMKTVDDESLISKAAGGIGTHISNIRPENSIIRGTGGTASGIIKQLHFHNNVAVTWNQGGRRKGSIAIYLEPWHGDIIKFLRAKLNQGDEAERARDLFYALWIPDLFMIRYEAGEYLSLFGEDVAPGLSEVYDGMMVCSQCNYCYNRAYAKYMCNADIPLNGAATPPTDVQSECKHIFVPQNVFTELYTKYEDLGLACNVVSCNDIVNAICEAQRETGTPYVCFKDHVNRNNAQESVGTIKSSNLCTEIMEWSSHESYATCTLASINLAKFVITSKDVANIKDGIKSFDHETLHMIVRQAAKNLDIVIDVNKYPVPECVENARRLRPIAIGIQGLANVFMMLRIPYISSEAAQLDIEIAETIYHAALTESCERARVLGAYDGFAHSPASRGELAFDMWIRNNKFSSEMTIFSGRYDWGELKQNIAKYGLRNSLVTANMPTVSTSQILGNVGSFEPIASVVYTKNAISGARTIIITEMVNHLLELNLWNDNIKNRIISANGSIQDIDEIPADVKKIYLTVYEMKQVELMKRCAIRQAFIDQGQSLNIHLNSNTNQNLKGVLTTGWKYGLKTGSYYIRTRPAVMAMKNTTNSLISCLTCTS